MRRRYIQDLMIGSAVIFSPSAGSGSLTGGAVLDDQVHEDDRAVLGTDLSHPLLGGDLGQIADIDGAAIDRTWRVRLWDQRK